MPYSLGQAISTNYQVPQSDIAGALSRGLQLEQAMAGRRAAAQLKREAAVARQDETYQKAFDALDFKNINPYVLPKVKEETAGLIAEANKLNAEDPIKNHMAARRKLQEAQNKIFEAQQLSINVDRFDKTPDEKLSGAARDAKKRLYESGDIRTLEGQIDPITGEGVLNSQIRFDVNDYADINKVRNDVLQNVTMDIIKENNLGNNQREFKYGIPKEITNQTAQELWSDKRIRDAYIKENREYVLGKYYKGVPEKMRSTIALSQDESVQEDLYGKFLKETENASRKFGKSVMDAIPKDNIVNINYGGNIDYGNQNAQTESNKITIKRPLTLNGQTQLIDVSVPTGNNYGFKPVKVLSLKSDDFINAAGNEKIKGQTLQETNTGSAIPVPVATKRFKNSKSGDVIEVGELVDENQLGSMQDQGAIKWVAMFPVTAKGKDDLGDATDISAFVPVEKVAQQVIVSQSKDDAPLTQKSIQAAVDEANKRNQGLPKSKSASPSKAQGAIDAFVAKYNRQPSSSERAKIEAKYAK